MGFGGQAPSQPLERCLSSSGRCSPFLRNRAPSTRYVDLQANSFGGPTDSGLAASKACCGVASPQPAEICVVVHSRFARACITRSSVVIDSFLVYSSFFTRNACFIQFCIDTRIHLSFLEMSTRISVGFASLTTSFYYSSSRSSIRHNSVILPRVAFTLASPMVASPHVFADSMQGHKFRGFPYD